MYCNSRKTFNTSELFIYFAIFFSVKPAFCIVIRQLGILMDWIRVN